MPQFSVPTYVITEVTVVVDATDVGAARVAVDQVQQAGPTAVRQFLRDQQYRTIDVDDAMSIQVADDPEPFQEPV